jgi:mannose-6-phosphate isomerase-like protein (cupin superfamily)
MVWLKLAYKLLHLMLQTKKRGAGGMEIVEISPNEKSLELNLHLGKGIILREHCTSWKAIKYWNFEWFQMNFPNVLVPTKVFQNKKQISTKHIPMQEALNFLLTEEHEPQEQIKHYPGSWHFFESQPELANWFSSPKAFENNLLYSLPSYFNFPRHSLYFANKFSQTPKHVDSFCVAVWIVVIKGCKKVTLHSGKQDEYNVTITLLAGDLVYIPPNVAHSVRHTEQCISLSTWYVSEVNFFLFEESIRDKFSAFHNPITKFFQSLTEHNAKLEPKTAVKNTDFTSLLKTGYIQREKIRLANIETEIEKRKKILWELEKFKSLL